MGSSTVCKIVLHTVQINNLIITTNKIKKNIMKIFTLLAIILLLITAIIATLLTKEEDEDDQD